MKISYYELLGMIRDGKQPKKVEFNFDIYVWENKNYRNSTQDFLLNDLAEYSLDVELFDSDIKIIEKEPKKIEKIGHIYTYGLNKNEEVIDDKITVLEEKINELVEAVNELKVKGE